MKPPSRWKRRARIAALLSAITVVLLEVTLQLLAVIVWIAREAPDQASDDGERVVLCLGDGRLQSREGTTRWRETDGALELRVGKRWVSLGTSELVTNRRDGRTEVWIGGSEVRLTSTDSPPDLGDVFAAIHAERFEAALKVGEQALAQDISPTTRARLHHTLAQATDALGDIAATQDHVRSIDALRIQHDDRTVLAIYLQALCTYGRGAEAVALGRDQPDDCNCALLWSNIAAAEFSYGDASRARAAAIKTCSCLPDERLTPDLAARIHHQLGLMFLRKPRELRQALHCFVTAHSMHADIERLRQTIGKVAQHVDATGFDHLVAHLDADEAAKQLARTSRMEWLAMQAADTSSAPSKEDAYRANLTQFIQRCEQHGAHAVISNYPIAHRKWIDDILVEVAAESGTTNVNAANAIRAFLRKQPDATLHVADGHCNDDGYAILAEAIAEAIAARPNWSRATN